MKTVNFCSVAVASPISIWELRAIRRRLEEHGRKEVDEELIFRTYEEMRSDEEFVHQQTKKTWRENQKRSYYSQIQHPAKTTEPSDQCQNSEKDEKSETDESHNIFQFPHKIKPFDDLEKL